MNRPVKRRRGCKKNHNTEMVIIKAHKKNNVNVYYWAEDTI